MRLAANGREALDALRAASLRSCADGLPDAGDGRLRGAASPARSGADAAAAGGARTVPVVALTANALAGDDERCLAAGFDAYLAEALSSRASSAQVVQRWLPARSSTARPTARGRARPAPPATTPLRRRRHAPRRRCRGARCRGARTHPRHGAARRARPAGAAGRDLPRQRGQARGRRASARWPSTTARRCGQAAHTLKSSSANLGATDFAAHCAELEALARDGAVRRRACSGRRRAEYERACARCALGAHGARTTCRQCTAQRRAQPPQRGAACRWTCATSAQRTRGAAFAAHVPHSLPAATACCWSTTTAWRGC
ncbi:MAG: Hpt domain-containing protein [Comamonadaceae bacterium]|nr:Hpt domain-containing protein [Comamonadaceae bacterium]